MVARLRSLTTFMTVMVAGIVGSAPAACSSFRDGDAEPVSEAGLADASRDAALDADAGDASDADASADAGPAPIAAMHFDDGLCSGWNVVGGSITPTSEAPHSGGFACRVCLANGGVMRGHVDVGLPPDKHLFVRLFVRGAGASPASGWRMDVRTNPDREYGFASGDIPSAGEWIPASVTSSTADTDAGQPISFDVQLLADADRAACFDIDDVEVFEVD